MQFQRNLPSLPRLGARAGVIAAILAAAVPAYAQQKAPATAAAPAPAAAGADATDPTLQSDWYKVCKEAADKTPKACLITRELRAKTGQPLASITIREVGDKKALLATVVPGMLIRPGMQVQIDGANATKVEYSICFPNVCYAEAEIAADYIAKLKSGSKLVVTALNQQAKPVGFPISLAGFTAAYDGPGIDPAELQAKEDTLSKELEKKAEAQRQEIIKKQQEQRSTQ